MRGARERAGGGAPALDVRERRVRARVEQHVHHRLVPAPRRPHERRPAVAPARVDVGAAAEQLLGALGVAVLSGVVQGQPAVGRGARHALGLLVQAAREELGVAEEGRLVHALEQRARRGRDESEGRAVGGGGERGVRGGGAARGRGLRRAARAPRSRRRRPREARDARGARADGRVRARRAHVVVVGRGLLGLGGAGRPAGPRREAVAGRRRPAVHVWRSDRCLCTKSLAPSSLFNNAGRNISHYQSSSHPVSPSSSSSLRSASAK